MGFAITWCAVREADAERFLTALELVRTGATESDPESPISTVGLRSGWRLVWHNDYDSKLLGAQNLQRISEAHDVLACRIEEHVMASSAEFWSQGRRRWWISHEGENGPQGLETLGDPPECFESIREEMERAQRADGGDEADVDHLFEIPVLVARTLVGFKHDEAYEPVCTGSFEVLERGKTSKGLFGWLSRS